MRKSSPVSLHTDNYNNINLCLVNSGPRCDSSPRTLFTLLQSGEPTRVHAKAVYKKQTRASFTGRGLFSTRCLLQEPILTYRKMVQTHLTAADVNWAERASYITRAKGFGVRVSVAEATPLLCRHKSTKLMFAKCNNCFCVVKAGWAEVEIKAVKTAL